MRFETLKVNPAAFAVAASWVLSSEFSVPCSMSFSFRVDGSKSRGHELSDDLCFVTVTPDIFLK